LLATRQAIVAAAGNGINAQLDLERDTQRRLGKLTDYREGVRAFKQKRAAAFTSR
jgi:2-(1,2-epoxy-1,2-dihydrophenyl)acetyl-CoA isomerase